MVTQMQLEVILAGNRIATRVCKAEAIKESIKTKPEAEIVSVSLFSKVLSLGLIVMPTNLEYRTRESGRPAKLNEKKSNRDLEREIKTKETFLLIRPIVVFSTFSGVAFAT